MRVASRALLLSLALFPIACRLLPEARSRPVVAWFTDAEIEATRAGPDSEGGLPAAPGTLGSGVRLTRAVAISVPNLSRERGFISFWIRPDWDGDDGRRHQLLRIGDPERNGMRVEKSARGILRFVMASPSKRSASRADVSHWRAGEWYHVALAWTERNGFPLGLPLYVDQVALDCPVVADNPFLDPDTMADPRLWVGHESAHALMDELIVRHDTETSLRLDYYLRGHPRAKGHQDALRQMARVYADYFRTAPFSAIRIDPEPSRVAADRRVIEGFPKQFGLEGRQFERWQDLTDFVGGSYIQWGAFDAKPMIRWTTSDPSVASVDPDGLVTGLRVGHCVLTARFRGMEAHYDLEVISVERPDLGIAFVSRLPRYLVDGSKNNPEPGDTVRSVAQVVNAGYAEVPSGVEVLFELFPDANGNYRMDPEEETQKIVRHANLGPLDAGETARIEFEWIWPPDPSWVRVSVDPDDRVPELSEANNRRQSRNTARALVWGFDSELFDEWHQGRTINVAGSFSGYDWIHSMVERAEGMARESVYPSTNPHGLSTSLRLDAVIDQRELHAEREGHEQKEEYRWREWWDGGWPHMREFDPMLLLPGLLHELGHTVFKLPDLYGYPVVENRVLLRDPEGRYYEGGELLPYVARDIKWTDGEVLLRPRVNGMMPCGVGYTSLMYYANLWIDESNAGKIEYFARKGERRWPFWGIQGTLVPRSENAILVTDVTGQPLAGAAVYVYQVAQGPVARASAKYFYDRPKFMGHTNERGRWVFPKVTDEDWDDPGTDRFDGRIEVSNPFSRAVPERPMKDKDYSIAFTPNVFAVEGLLLLKIVSGEQTEFHWLSLTDLNNLFFENEEEGTLPIRTNLDPAKGVTPLVRSPIAEAVREKNLRPVAIVEPTRLTLEVGEEFRLDGSESYDPEGQPLVLTEWLCRGLWRDGELNLDEEGANAEPAIGPVEFKPVLDGRAPGQPGELRYDFYVNDGLRVSKAVHIKIDVVEKRPDGTTKPQPSPPTP